MIIWGNHSSTMFPDIHNTMIGKKKVFEYQEITQDWYEKEFIPIIQQRGSAIIQARGASSAASAANAAIDHMNDWVTGVSDWVR